MTVQPEPTRWQRVAAAAAVGMLIAALSPFVILSGLRSYTLREHLRTLAWGYRRLYGSAMRAARRSRLPDPDPGRLLDPREVNRGS